jgi:stage V sporulation protein D (sporulation-specific penicillin-binding protein)
VKKKKLYFSRAWIVYILLTVMMFAVLGKLFYLQVIKAAELKARGATLRGDNNQAMIYNRGMITDAQGNILAKSIPAKDIYADPKYLTTALKKKYKGITDAELLEKKKAIADDLASILEKDSSTIFKLLSQDSSWVSLAKQVEMDKVEQIKDLDISGIGYTDIYKRIYPAGNMAASVLGIVNMAGDGVEGLEYSYNEELNGDQQFETEDGAVKPREALVNENVQTGYNLTLTLDSTIQHLVERELNSIVEETQPQGAVIIAMEPKTGKILGMGSRPTFDPNNYADTRAEDRKNLAISMVYEPGSTFKIITAAAALEENKLSPTKKYNDPGYLVVGSRTITNWDSDRKAHGVISFADGMKLSSNVVLAQVGKELGKETFYTYLKSFGFGSKTKIDIAGEEQGLLLDLKAVKDLELATMSFGQANLVTPIQLLTAVCAAANGGNLMQPYIVERITDAEGRTLHVNQPKVTRQVISPSTSKIVNEILVGVVTEGTGSRAKIPGIEVAGKTGTAQKIDPQTGAYSSTDFIVSFVGYAPASDPKIAVLVVIDTPRSEVVQGGTLAGPRVKNIIQGALQYYGLAVSSETPSSIIDTTQQEQPAKHRSSSQETTTITPGKGETVVPDLIGLTMREAGQKLGEKNLRYIFAGSGLASKQFPEPGKIVNQGDTVEVLFGEEEN